MSDGPQDSEGARAGETSWSAIERGDLDYVVRRHWQPVYRFLRSRLKSHDQAEDATQEFFLKFIERDTIGRLDQSRGSCRSFVFHVARQFLIDFYRTQGSRRATVAAPLDAGDFEEVPWGGARPEEEFDRLWFLSILDQARQAVRVTFEKRGNPHAYEAFNLFYFGRGDLTSWPQKQIAEELGIPSTQVNNYVHRARKIYSAALREIVAGYSSPLDFKEEMAALGAFLEKHSL